MSVSEVQCGRLRLSSEPQEVERLISLLDQILGQTRLGALEVFQFRCAVVEVFNNCCRHAYRGEPGFPVEFEWSITPTRLSLTVSDRGPPFTPPKVSAANDPLAESGRGFEIIEAGADLVQYRRENGWNRCRLELELSSPVSRHR